MIVRCKSVHWSRAERLLVCRSQCPPAQCNATNANWRKTRTFSKGITMQCEKHHQLLQQKRKLKNCCPNVLLPNAMSSMSSEGRSTWETTTSSCGKNGLLPKNHLTRISKENITKTICCYQCPLAQTHHAIPPMQCQLEGNKTCQQIKVYQHKKHNQYLCKKNF